MYPLAFLWGLAEATLFFIVPDVLLSLLALKDRRRPWIACGYAVAGALLGGALMYAWAAHDAGADTQPAGFDSRHLARTDRAGAPAAR